MLEAAREALCGPRYEHSEHGAHRAGHVRGELAMGGRRVEVKRPRVRSIQGREVSLPTWQHFGEGQQATLTRVPVGRHHAVARFGTGASPDPDAGVLPGPASFGLPSLFCGFACDCGRVGRAGRLWFTLSIPAASTFIQ